MIFSFSKNIYASRSRRSKQSDNTFMFKNTKKNEIFVTFLYFCRRIEKMANGSVKYHRHWDRKERTKIQ